MNRSFDRIFRCNRRRFGRWADPNQTNPDIEQDPSMSAVMQKQLIRFRTRIHRSPNGKVLGVLQGIAESMGWPVTVTRVLGCIAMLCIASFFGVNGFMGTLLACGFFYLLLALLMGQSHTPDAGATVDYGAGMPSSRPWNDPRPGAASAGPMVGQRPPPIPSAGAYGQSPRVDLAALDRQLDGLNRRIRRMEAIVTDRQYDWEQRLGQSGTGE